MFALELGLDLWDDFSDGLFGSNVHLDDNDLPIGLGLGDKHIKLCRWATEGAKDFANGVEIVKLLNRSKTQQPSADASDKLGSHCEGLFGSCHPSKVL